MRIDLIHDSLVDYSFIGEMLGGGSGLSLEYIKDNVIADVDESVLKDEKILNQGHLYNAIYSGVMDCNPHTKVKYRCEAMTGYVQGKSDYVVFVPSSATEPIVIDNKAKNITIDIRGLDVKGKQVLKLFENITSDHMVSAKSELGKTGKIYMTPTKISDTKTTERPKCPLSGRNVTVLIDRYTLNELDEYCTLMLDYFFKHFRVKGKPHKMYKYIFKEIRVGKDKKYVFAIPVIKITS